MTAQAGLKRYGYSSLSFFGLIAALIAGHFWAPELKSFVSGTDYDNSRREARIVHSEGGPEILVQEEGRHKKAGPTASPSRVQIPGLNTRDANGRTALIWAALNSQADLARFFAESGAEIDALDRHGRTALNYSAEKGDVETARMLLDRGANANILDGGGYSPLMRASENGHVPVIELLLKHGAVTHSKNLNGKTALTLAIDRAERYRAAAALLKNHSRR
jgi:hypothetical protein